MLTVVDLGVSNLRSIVSSLRYLGAEFVVTDAPEVVEAADRLILPGVGAFDAAVQRMDTLGLRRTFHALAESRVPILGVCLGMQLLFEGSEEGSSRGLGLFEGRVVRLGADPFAKVPHVGFDAVRYASDSWFESTVGASGSYYFTHSFAVREVETGVSSGFCDYDGGFVAAAERWPAVGVQFHPEKSQAEGLRLIHAFLRREATAP